MSEKISHLRSLINPPHHHHCINNTCIQCLETLPREAMENIIKEVIVAFNCCFFWSNNTWLFTEVSVHDMKYTQHGMKTSSLGAKRQRG